MSNPAAYIQPIQFEDFDGSQFERLVFAYHARREMKVERMVRPGGATLLASQNLSATVQSSPLTPERAVLCIGGGLGKQLWW
jgi:hypothetical protein